MTQRTISWNTPYTFSGKEKDVETGYGYFGARYYDSGLSIWLSVDPMSDKYPSMSPYNYCANNPVILVDPDGEEIYVSGYLYKNGSLVDKFGNEVPLVAGSFEHKVLTSLNEIANIKNNTGENDEGKDLISSRFNDLMKDGKEHNIVEKSVDYSSSVSENAGLGLIPGGSSTDIGLTGNGRTQDGKFFNLTLVLSHELLGHSWDKSVGVDSREKTENGIPNGEVSAVNVQNLVAKAQGIKVKRTRVGSKEIPKELLDTYFTKRK